MKEFALPITAVSGTEKSGAKAIDKQKKRWTFLACFFAVSGTLCGVIGFLLTILSLVETDQFQKYNSRIGSFFIIAVLPLFFLAAHSLDKLELIKKIERNTKQKLFTVSDGKSNQ